MPDGQTVTDAGLQAQAALAERAAAILELGAAPPPGPPTAFDAKQGLNHGDIHQALRERGFCIIRNLFANSTLDETAALADRYLRNPAIAGAPGYVKLDHPKVVINPFELGGPTLDILLNEEIIDIIEEYMGSECILAETGLKHDFASTYNYFPIHTDFAVGWAKSDKIEHKMTLDELREVVGIGGAFYFHDTTAGAFCYCDGTHALLAPKGQVLARYSKAEQAAILSRRVPCIGKRGDMILFDDRGFHGPDFPSKADRRVILLDYFRVDTIGRLQVMPMPIWSTDIAKLTPKQLRVAGVGAEPMVSALEHSKTRFRKNRFYPLASWIVRNAYYPEHLKAKLRARLGRT